MIKNEAKDCKLVSTSVLKNPGRRLNVCCQNTTTMTCVIYWREAHETGSQIWKIQLLFPFHVSSYKMQSCAQLRYYVKRGDCTVNIAMKGNWNHARLLFCSSLWRRTRLPLTCTAMAAMSQSRVATALLWLHRKFNQFWTVWIEITRKAEIFLLREAA